MIRFCEAHFFVIVFRFKVRRVKIEDRVRTVILGNELFKVLVFDDNRLQSFRRFVNDGKVVPDVVRLTSEGVKPRSVTLPNNLIKECGAFDIRYPGIAVEQIADIVKVPAGIKRIPQFIAKLVGCSLPILAEKLGFDPAVMASPFITTIVDALALLAYFGISLLVLSPII